MIDRFSIYQVLALNLAFLEPSMQIPFGRLPRFNPRSPRGERCKSHHLCLGCDHVSIRAPHAGSDVYFGDFSVAGV